MRASICLTFLIASALAGACSQPAASMRSPTAPSPRLESNFTGRFAGGYVTTTCTILTPRGSCRPANLPLPWMHLTLAQSGNVITGTAQTTSTAGNVTGTIDEWGRLYLQGVLFTLGSRGNPAPREQIVAWRSVIEADTGRLAAAFSIHHIDFDGTLATVTVNDMAIQRCTIPNPATIFDC